MNEAPNVSRYEASTRGAATASQNCGQVMEKLLNSRASSGISTMRLR